jgi:hypothetical protein
MSRSTETCVRCVAAAESLRCDDLCPVLRRSNVLSLEARNQSFLHFLIQGAEEGLTRVLREVSLMSENKSNNKRLPGFLVSPVVLLRLSSILVVLLMVGHMSAYPWSTHGLQETQLVDSMKTLQFEFMGERSSYWSLYFGWGLLVGVLLLTLALILWSLSDIAHLAPRSIGIISGVISASSLVGAYISFRFFYVPPFLFDVAICVILLTVAVQLLRQQRMVVDEKWRNYEFSKRKNL